MEREKIKTQAKKTIDDLFFKLDKLEKQAENAEGAEKERLEKKIKDLKEKKADLLMKYDKIKTATGESLKQIGSAFEESAGIFKNTLKRIRDNYNK